MIGGPGGITDAAGNPLAGDLVWTFTTQLDSVVDTTAADFLSGTPDAGIYVAQAVNGELTLLPSLATEFGGAALPTGWSGTPWSATGTFGVAGGAVTVDGARVSPAAVAGSGASLEFRATFSTDTFGHVGFGVTFLETPWAIFSTGAGGGALYARTHDGISAIDTPIPGSWLGSPHTYRIDWNSASVTFFIDGVEVASRAVTIAGLLRPIVSDANVGGGSLTVDWLRLTPYATSGTFVSRVLTTGAPTDWARANWTAVVPASTTLTLAARFGDTPTPDGSWTGFIALPTADTSLTQSSIYVQNQAIFAGTGIESPVLSDVSFLGTPSGITNPPGAPTNVIAVAGNAQATVSFTPPASTGGAAITGYTVTPYVGAIAQTPTAAASSPVTVTGLTNGTAYTFTVTATNSVGTGAASAPSNAVTPATVPGAPTNVTAVAGDAQAAVSFTAPASNGGAAITGYAITPYVGGVAQTPTTGADSPVTVTGLTNGTAYTFTVTASNSVGAGAASAPSNAVTPGAPTTLPGAPTSVSAVGGNAEATVSFVPPVSDGGAAITSYTVTPYVGAIAQTPTAGASSPVTVTGLTNGTAYTFTVTATNSVGTGAASAPSNAVTPATVPGAPTNVTAVAGNTQATVSFAPPASTGGTAITGYTVTPYAGGVAQPPTTGASSPVTVTGLTNGTTYTFTVSATNNVGTGAASAASAAVTPATLPGAPTGVTAVAGNAQATVSFVAPASNGGAAITSYTVTPYVNGVAQPPTTGASSPVTVAGLTNGTTYTFTVSATNNVGTGAASAASAAVTPATLPGAPTGVTAVAGNAQATVSFVAPASNGGAAITSYTVTPYVNGVAQPPTTGASSPVTVTGLTNGTTYTFSVSAINGVGAGVPSAPSNPVTPSVTGPPVTTTVTLTSIGTQDGRVLESSETSNVGGSLTATNTSSTALRLGDDSGDRQYKGVLSFDTSSIPDGATVTGVTLELVRGGSSGTNPFSTHGSLNVDVQSGGFSGNVALETSDFQATAAAVGVATMSTVTSSGQVSSASFGPTGLAAVNKTGTTQVRLYFTLDDNDDLGNDYVGFYSGSNSTSANRPRLIVTYALVPTAPGAPTSVSAEGGNAQATVSFLAPAEDGGSAIAEYIVTPYVGGAPQTPTTGASSPVTVTGLANGTAYTFTVAATNALGTGPASTPSNSVTPSNQPVTVTLTSIGTQDGWVRESTETSNVGGNLSSTGTGGSAVRAGDDSSDRQYKGVLSFDTSSIPDGATITGVTLELTRGGGSGTNPFTTHGTLNVDVQSGGFSGSEPLQSSDFHAVATAVGVATMSTVNSSGQVSSASFDPAGLTAVNKAGTTQVRLYFELDDNDDLGNDYVGFYSSSNSTSSNRPRLIVTYTP